PNKPADIGKRPAELNATVWPMAHRGISLPLAGGSHQLGLLIDPIHPPLDSGAASLNSRSGADGSGGIAGAMTVCALAIAGIEKNATRTSVGRPGTLGLTLRAGCWSCADDDMSCKQQVPPILANDRS